MPGLFPDLRNDEFESFWREYPRKIAKPYALKCWARARRQAPAETIMRGLVNFKASISDADPKFIPHPSTWLNQGRWMDYQDAVLTPPSKSHISKFDQAVRAWLDNGKKGPPPNPEDYR